MIIGSLSGWLMLAGRTAQAGSSASAALYIPGHSNRESSNRHIRFDIHLHTHCSGEDKLTLNSRMEKNMEPIFFMVEYTGCMLIWSTRVVVPSHPTPAQEETLETLYFAAMLAPGYHREQVGETYEECVRKAKELH